MIAPPSVNSADIDSYTAKNSDYTHSDPVNNRVFRVNLGILKYGTNDQTHAAALVLSAILLVAAIAFMIIGLWQTESALAAPASRWLENAFLIVVGVAIGKSASTYTNTEN